ncbi:GHKL domain-containing protein [Lachnospiraceae bacterium]|jgi:two-component system sensor histidine kinase AgrC|nr:ATP-binding protein [uncultured Schaedlerella sp.]MCI9155236.1 GHKL domain-containing protein [Ruminococcus sp.]NBI56651.1 GHKL domain-containing protein [Lachnospiraceae bacterium]
MEKSRIKLLYRILCTISLVIGLYLVTDLMFSGTLNVKMIIVFILVMTGIIWGAADWKMSSDLIRNQEKELKMYRLYIQPLEELVKEIRARQHEFDNHINAILNMHLTVDNYEELVEKQSQYILEIRRDSASKFLPLLRISDKVLAGFLYSKIVSSPENADTDVEVRNWQILSRTSEHNLIEIVGVLVDNAYEAVSETGGRVRIFLDSREDKMVFEILNEYRRISFEELERFFENGYTTKDSKNGRRGVGLARVKSLIQKADGEITVAQEMIEEKNYIHITVVI